MSSLKHPAQRVGVFVDVQNLYYSAKALYGHKVNFGEILKEAVAGRQLVRAIAYTIRAEMPEEQTFFDALEGLGFEVKTKDLQTFVSGQKKGDWDVGVAVDILKMAPKLDAIVLVSGDGDYTDLLHHAKAEGCRAEVISFGKSTSQKLTDEADDFIDLDKESERFTLKARAGNGRTATKPSAKPAVTPKPATPTEPNAITPAAKPPIPVQRPKKGDNLEDAILKAVDAKSQESEGKNSSASNKPKKFRIF